MTQEEKAKAYDEAYKVAKDIHRFSSDLADIKRMEQIFPELAESEDEKIKNWIIAKLTQTCGNATGEEDKDVVEKYHKACAWLEKQSEQKLVDKDEPKFKVGDWITDGEALLCITKFEIDYGYELKSIDGEVFHFVSPDLVEANYHLYTIQDAKDGDVIFYDNGWACIFKNIHGIWYSSYCFITADGEFHTGYEEHAIDSKINGNANPATKEQRDTFFAKMKDAGFTFDFNKKELKKIEQLSVWSEEDENNLNDAVWAVREIYTNGCGEEEMESWLKSLKERVQPHPRQKWSEEDEIMCTIAINACKYANDEFESFNDNYEKALIWLKSLKERLQIQPKQER